MFALYSGKDDFFYSFIERMSNHMKADLKRDDVKHAEMLLKAKKAVSLLRLNVTRNPHRLSYHFMAPTAWINESNGSLTA
jgi:sucrose-6-phosphate hydrolase SacC (GH32 family)